MHLMGLVVLAESCTVLDNQKIEQKHDLVCFGSLAEKLMCKLHRKFTHILFFVNL